MGSRGDMADPGAFGWVRSRRRNEWERGMGTCGGGGVGESTVFLKEGHIPLLLEELVDAQQTTRGHTGQMALRPAATPH